MKSKNSLLPVFFSLILTLLFAVNLKGESLKGKWYAMTDIYSFKLRIVLHIDSMQNGYLVRSDIPEWNEYGKTIRNFSYEPPNFRFVLYKRYTFEGRVNSGSSQITGEFKYEDFIQRLTLMMRTPYSTDFEGGENFSPYLTVTSHLITTFR